MVQEKVHLSILLQDFAINPPVKVFVCGLNLDDDPKTIKGNIGVVPQEVNIDPFFTPIEIMNIQSGMYGVKQKEEHNFQILKNLGLDEKAKAYSRSLSEV